MKITPDIIEQINELYLEIKVKKRVAEKLGISASTVSKYIDPAYVPKAERVKIEFDVAPPGCGDFIQFIGGAATRKEKFEKFCEYCELSEEEVGELKNFTKYC